MSPKLNGFFLNGTFCRVLASPNIAVGKIQTVIKPTVAQEVSMKRGGFHVN
jgi:hypothetical protein